MTRMLLTFAILSGLLLPAWAQTPADPAATQPAAVDAETMARAEGKLLRRVVEQQREEIAALRRQIEQLTEQLKSLGIAPAVADAPSASAQATTQPAEKQPVRRVVFVMLHPRGAPEIERAVHELAPDQWFNIVAPRGDQAEPFQPQLVQPTARIKEKLPAYLKQYGYMMGGPWQHTLSTAIKWRPDVIWLIANMPTPDPDALVAEVHKINAGAKARINTTTAYAAGVKEAHTLWRIAHETGGVCVDRSGQPIDEPVLPIPAPKPAEPARKPSILREGQ